MYNSTLDYAYTQVDINPHKHYIYVDYIGLMRDYPVSYDKQVQSLIAHEIQHLIDWYIICRKNVEVWNTQDKLLENRANTLQDKILALYI
jgi:hypothetical protein